MLRKSVLLLTKEGACVTLRMTQPFYFEKRALFGCGNFGRAIKHPRPPDSLPLTVPL